MTRKGFSKEQQSQLTNKEHLTKEDLIRLKCLSELLESTVLCQELYDALPGIDTFTPNLGYQEENRASTVFQHELPPTKF